MAAAEVNRDGGPPPGPLSVLSPSQEPESKEDLTVKHTVVKLVAGAAALGLLVAAPAVANGDGDHDPQAAKSTEATEQEVCSSNDLVVTFVGDQTLWPPNHKYSPLTIVATNDGLTDINLTTTITHDEYLGDYVPSDGDEEQPEEPGSGNTINDARPFAMSDSESSPNENAHEVRAERSGRGNGRTYTITAMADDMDSRCEGSVTVEVPHDMGNGAENKTDHTEDGS